MPETKTFNPDARAKDRESAKLTIGGVKYRRRRRTNAITKTQRALERENTALVRQLDELGREMRAIGGQDDDGDAPASVLTSEDRARLEELDDEVSALDEKVEQLLFRRVAVMLAPAEGEDQEVDPEPLGEHLDIADARALWRWLDGDVDPTEPTTTNAE